VVDNKAAKFSVYELLFSRLTLDSLQLEGVQLYIQRNEEGLTNWSVDGEYSVSSDWDVTLGKVLVKQAGVFIDGFSAQKQRLVVRQIKLSEQQDERDLMVDGVLNGYPFRIKGTASCIFDYLLKRRPALLDLSGEIEGLRVDVSGSVADGVSELSVAVSSADLSDLATVLGVEFPALGKLTASGEFVYGPSIQEFTKVDVEMLGDGLTFDINGEAALNNGDYELELEVNASADDLGEIPLDELSQFRGWSSKFSGQIIYQEEITRLSHIEFLAAGNDLSLTVNIEGGAYTHRGEQNASLQLGPANYELAIQESSRIWRYQYQSTSLNMFGDSISFADQSHFRIDSTGFYKKIPLSIAGDFRLDGDYDLAIDFAETKGRLRGFIQEDKLAAIGDFQISSMQPIAALLNRNPILSRRAELSFDVLFTNHLAVLNDLDFLILDEQTRIGIKARSPDLYRLEEFQYDVALRGEKLSTLQQRVQAHATIIERTTGALGDYRSYASSGDFAYLKVNTDVEPWMDNLLGTLQIPLWLRRYPQVDGRFLADLKIAGNQSGLSIKVPEAWVKSEFAEVHWVGDVYQRGADLDLQGIVTADLAAGIVEGILTPLSFEAHISRHNDKPIQTHMTGRAGRSQFTNNLVYQIDGELKAVHGNLDFSFLDLSPYIQVRKKVDMAGRTTGDDFLALLSEKPLVFDWLPTYDISMTVHADRLESPWGNLDAVSFNVQHDGYRFELDNIEALAKDSPIRSHFKLLDYTSSPAIDFQFKGEQLDASLFSLLGEFNVLEAGSIDLLLDVDAVGSSAYDLTASMNGQFTMVTRNALLNGSDLDEVAPDVLTQINRRINPFSRPTNNAATELSCAVIHFDIDEGLMAADRSIVLVTPNIVFGANGAIDMRNKTLTMQFVPQTRRGLGLSLRGGAARMAVINGPIESPEISFDPGQVAMRGGSGVAGTLMLGPIYWLYLGQAQRLLASPRACEQAIARVAPEFSQPDSDQ
jgi:hypothetical protein